MADIDKLIVTVNCEECIGDGVCCDDAPNTFKMNDDGCAEVQKGSTDDRDTIVGAAKNCPTDAITVKDKESGEQLAP